MILIVILIIIFAGMILFLFTLAETVEQEDYMELYVNNLALSVMKTDTGFSDSKCKLVSDAVACAFVESSWPCGDSGRTCFEIANQTIGDHVSSFETISKNYRYLVTVESVEFCSRVEGAECRVMMFGDPGLEDFAGKKRTANYAIQKTLAGNNYNLKVRLYIARRTG